MTTEALIGAEFVQPPYAHQLEEFERKSDVEARALGWTMRTGKSKACVDRACHLYKNGGENGRIDGVLVFAPNGVHANWVEKEFPKHTWKSVPWSGLVWCSGVSGSKAVNRVPWSGFEAWLERRAAWWDQLARVRTDHRLMVLAVNSESMTRDDVRKAVARFIRHRNVYLIVDESDDFGTPGAKRTKMIRALARRCRYRDILSGTLVTATPLAAFSQFEILERGALGFETFAEFKAHFAEYEQARGLGGRAYPKLVGYKNLDELRARMARFMSVVTREDCPDLPDLIRETRRVEPSPEQLEIYRELHNSFVVDVANDRVSVGERAPRFQKLQQVFSGFVIDEQRRVVQIPGANPRLEALADEIYLTPGKVIVWCQFHADFKNVRERLLADGYKVVEYHGGVSDGAKSQALTRFREDRDVKALVGHARSGGRGLTIPADAVFWYSHTFSARFRTQAMERATVIGGKNIRVVDFVAPGPDEYILSVTDKRVDVADDIAGRGMSEFLKGLTL